MTEELISKNTPPIQPPHDADFIGPKLITTTDELKAGLSHDFQGVPFESSREQALHHYTTLIDSPLPSIMQAIIFRSGEYDTEYKAESDKLDKVIAGVLKNTKTSEGVKELASALTDVRAELYGQEIEAKQKRIDEESQRTAIEYIPRLSDLRPSQVAVRPDGINEHTEAYVGRLEKDTLQTLFIAGIGEIYTNPNDYQSKAEFRIGVPIGGGTKAEKLANAIDAGLKFDRNALETILSDNFVVTPDQRNLTLVSLNPRTIGRNLIDVKRQIEHLGLDFVPPEVVFQLRDLFLRENWELLATVDNEALYLGMEPKGRYGGVFVIGKDWEGKGLKIGETMGYATGEHIAERARVLFALKPKPDVDHATNLA